MGEWKEYRLGDICDIYDGPHATPPKLESGNIFLGISSLGFDGRIDPAHFEYVSEEALKKWTRRVEPKYQDIVFSYETKLGVAAMIPQGFKCCLGRRMGLLRPKDGVEPRFLLYAYLAPDFQKTIYERTYHGSTVDRIPLKNMHNFPIGIPLLEEQKAIASVLSSLDDKIDLLHRQNKTLEALAETLFRQWFVEQAQEDWEEGSIGNFAVNSKDGIKPSDIYSETKYIGLEHIHRRSIALIQYGSASDVTSNKFQFSEDDILFGKLRPYFHKVCFAPYSGVCSTDILVIRPKKPDYFAYCLFAFYQSAVVEYANIGSGGTRMPRTNWETLTRYPVAMPDNAKLCEFNKLVVPSINKIKQNIVQIHTLEKLRDTLLPKLMSGEVRLAV